MSALFDSCCLLCMIPAVCGAVPCCCYRQHSAPHLYIRDVVACSLTLFSLLLPTLLALSHSLLYRPAALQNTNALVIMSLPCSDQSIRPTKMKSASLPRGVEVLRCWCGDLCKVKEVTDFSDWLGMKFFMCANYEEDPPVAISPYIRPPVCFSHEE